MYIDLFEYNLFFMTTLESRFGNIKTFYQHKSIELLNNLSTNEKLFAYHMTNASIKGYNISLFQSSNLMNDLLSDITDVIMKNDKKLSDEDHVKFMEQLKSYWVYLFANNGVHFVRKYENNKMTPKMLKLDMITAENLELYGVKLSHQKVDYLFNEYFKPTATVSGNIEESGNNYHGPDMTTDIFDTLSDKNKSMLNAYHCVDGTTHVYSTEDICGEYLKQSLHHIELALEVVNNDKGEHFDEHCKNSLISLIEFLKSGDEELFREHSKHWAKMNNKVEYNYGFIEQYDDPMGNIGEFQADVTVKSLNMEPLLKLLPNLEKQFSFPEEWKRKDMSVLPNAAEAYKIVGIGGLGPAFKVLAYCLPNYDDIRSEYGSKQVMYNTDSLRGNIELRKKISYNDEELAFLNEHSPDLKLLNIISSLSVTLHETIGHGSGNLDTYIDADGNKQPLTRELLQSRLGQWTRGLEEMRAEILSLYTAITFYDDIVKVDGLGDWPSKIPKDKMIELIILNMIKSGPGRWHSVVEGSDEVKGAHPMANTGITYYLLDNSDDVVMEEVEIDNDGTKIYDLRFKITNIENVVKCISELAYTVQRFTSTAPTEEVDAFMKKYAISTRDKTYSKKMKDKSDYLNDMVELNLQIFPEWKLTVVDDKLVDVEAYTPDNAFDALMNLYKMTK